VCVWCKFAESKKTANGRRHPAGSGVCTYQFPDLPLPLWALSQYWGRRDAKTVGEYIEGARWIYYTHSGEARTCGTREAL
jgi:hypothetical protein